MALYAANMLEISDAEFRNSKSILKRDWGKLPEGGAWGSIL